MLVPIECSHAPSFLTEVQLRTCTACMSAMFASTSVPTLSGATCGTACVAVFHESSDAGSGRNSATFAYFILAEQQRNNVQLDPYKTFMNMQHRTTAQLHNRPPPHTHHHHHHHTHTHQASTPLRFSTQSCKWTRPMRQRCRSASFLRACG